MSRSRLFFAFSTGSLTLEQLKANPVVPGVSLLSVGPAKGHYAIGPSTKQPVPMFVDATTLQQVMAVAAASYATGLRVNVGHFSGVTEAAGYISAMRIDGEKLRGDLNLFRTCSPFEHLCELVCTIPDTFGLSIDFDGQPEIADGKAFARCTEIYSCDLVTEPAANEGGLFSAQSPRAAALLRSLFDNPANTNMATEPTTPPAQEPPATTPAPQTPAPLTLEQVQQAIAAAIASLTTSVTGLTQRMTAVEAALAADEASDAAAPSAFKRLRSDITALQAGVQETNTKLARRLGIEFAARAGATAVEAPAAGSGATGTETRKPFEIPAAEHNAAQIAARNR